MEFIHIVKLCAGGDDYNGSSDYDPHLHLRVAPGYDRHVTYQRHTNTQDTST